MKWFLKRIFGGIGIVVLILILGYQTIHPWLAAWGSTTAEVARAMPGDLDGNRWTRSITINATPQQIWPWLVQWGQGRGGWYSYDWLENLMGFDIHTTDQILPQYQNPAVGDKICMAASSCTNIISVIQPNQAFGWQARDEQGSPVWNFIIGLYPVDSAHTRLVIRESFDKAAMPAIVTAIIEIPDTVMEQKTLDTLKQRAEGTPRSAATTPLEIGFWLAALVMGVTAAVLYMRRTAWQQPLAVGTAAVLVLLGLTFLYPPLWLRALLDLALLGGLVWTARQRA
jgi:hypothetical protein